MKENEPMVNPSKTYTIDHDLEAALIAAAASGNPVRVKGTKTYRVRIDSTDIWDGYDPEGLLDVVKKSAEHPYSAEPAELEDLLADLKAAREQDSSGRPA